MPVQPAYDRSIDLLEMAQLIEQWGEPALQHVSMGVDHPFLTGEHQMLTMDGRRAEICYVMHRGDPQAGLLMHIKTFYPAGAYRLPTGGIQVGESVIDTLGREIHEETGLTVGDGPEDVRVQRLLGVLGYSLEHPQLGAAEFATYFFLVEMPPDAELHPLDEHEHIAGWDWRTPAQLPAVADLLDAIHTRSATWADWGRFRAAGHRFVAARLNTSRC